MPREDNVNEAAHAIDSSECCAPSGVQCSGDRNTRTGGARSVDAGRSNDSRHHPRGGQCAVHRGSCGLVCHGSGSICRRGRPLEDGRPFPITLSHAGYSLVPGDGPRFIGGHRVPEGRAPHRASTLRNSSLLTAIPRCSERSLSWRHLSNVNVWLRLP